MNEDGTVLIQENDRRSVDVDPQGSSKLDSSDFRSGVSLSPVLGHIHIPKAAGTSLVYLLQQAGKSHVNLYVDDTHFVYKEQDLVRDVLSNKEVKSFSSHYVLTFPPYLGGRRMLYFTILRDPVEQVISYLTFIKKRFKTMNNPNLAACLPPDPTSLSLREFARWLLTEKRDEVPFHENYTVNFLAQETYRALNCGTRLDRLAYRSARLVLAKSILDQFVFVGLAESMDDSMKELRQIAPYLGVEIPRGAIGTENISNELRDDLRWTDPDDEVGAMLHASVEEDRRLYEWAKERFDSHFWLKRFQSFDAMCCGKLD